MKFLQEVRFEEWQQTCLWSGRTWYQCCGLVCHPCSSTALHSVALPKKPTTTNICISLDFTIKCLPCLAFSKLVLQLQTWEEIICGSSWEHIKPFQEQIRGILTPGLPRPPEDEYYFLAGLWAVRRQKLKPIKSHSNQFLL